MKIAPSLMCADPLDLGGVVANLCAAGVDYLHVDVMDGHYVPNMALGPGLCRALAVAAPIPLDIHLMVEEVESVMVPFLDAVAGAPGTVVSFHPEVVRHPLRTVDKIRAAGAMPAIAIEPAMPVATVRPLLDAVELVCVLLVNPGFSGQALLSGALQKVAALRDLRDRAGLRFEIEVDGNVSWEHAPAMLGLGADVFVCGSSSLFDGGDLAGNIRRFRALVPEGPQERS